MAKKKKPSKNKASIPTKSASKKIVIQKHDKQVLSKTKTIKSKDVILVNEAYSHYKPQTKLPALKQITQTGTQLNKRLSSLSAKIRNKINQIDDWTGLDGKEHPVKNVKTIVGIMEDQQIILMNQINKLEVLYLHLSTIV